MIDDDALHAALAWLRKQPDVRYAEVRLVDDGGERLRVRDGRPEQVTAEASRGVGIRVLGSKTWGFACSARHERRGPSGHRGPRAGDRARLGRRGAEGRRLPGAGGVARGLRDAARHRSVHDSARDQARRPGCPGARAPHGRRPAEVRRGLDGLDAADEAHAHDRRHGPHADVHLRRVRHERLRQLRRRRLAAPELPHLAGRRTASRPAGSG